MRSNYIDILSHRVEIPIIQRDYAQGRTDSKTSKIRKDFLDVLFGFISDKSRNHSTEIELDFIYGFNDGDDLQTADFIPIDGQQRLTTLWLLYWLVATKENVPANEGSFLSNFVYETRHSTTQFCRELLEFLPAFSDKSIAEEIKNQPWYFETWDYDPTIQAMLVVLEDIENRYTRLNNNALWELIGNTSCPFFFYKLDMKKVGLTDDLYIKMNSRGKALTEFEYFKAGFSELIGNPAQKERFDHSIDGRWIDTIWHVVLEAGAEKEEDDIALIVDSAFLNLFNFITSIISLKKNLKTDDGERYTDTVNTAELLENIYSDTDNQLFLFDTLDAICEQYSKNPTFWDDIFYFGKNGSAIQKTRLFFQHGEPNLLKLCLLNPSGNRGLSFPEQLLLLGCFTHLKSPNQEYSKRIRTVRNLVVNSENELRESILGNSFGEVEDYMLNGNPDIFKNFKTDQIEEEKQKEHFLQHSPDDIVGVLYQLEDSDIFRGSISLFPLDAAFGDRAKKFLDIFDEDEFPHNFREKSNLLLCFGDYTQNDGSLTNMMARNKAIIRGFLTTPGYNKAQFNNKTRKVVMDCLDFFNTNSSITAQQIISDKLTYYSTSPKDWRYYFLKYDSFRDGCSYGYYKWEDYKYRIWKMGKKQFNGYHWDPFLYEIYRSAQSNNMELDNYGGKLLVIVQSAKIWITSISNGFLLENALGSNTVNPFLDDLINLGIISLSGELIVSHNNDGIDTQDRIEFIKQILNKPLDKYIADESKSKAI